MIWRSSKEQPRPTKVERRLSGLSSSEVIGWCETAVSEAGRGLRGDLQEGEKAAEVLLAGIRELRRRSQQ